jgi:hypothetical protein
MTMTERAKPVRERDPPRGDVFQNEKIGGSWVRGPLSDLASMRAGASCLFISMSSRTICHACGVGVRRKTRLFVPRSAG